MTLDLSEVLADWPYEPGQINVRVIDGNDGNPRIQVRLDLGVLQMNFEGRPDGTRPHGFTSYLDYFEHRLETDDPRFDLDAHDGDDGPDLSTGDPTDAIGPAANADPQPESSLEDDAEPGPDPADEHDDEGFAKVALSNEDCRLLRDEAAQYYHRYVALLVLEDYEGVVRDTTRNLRVLDLCAQHAEDPEDRQTLEQVRPYITMMRARALASHALEDREPKAALLAIDDGLDKLRVHFESLDTPEAFEHSSEAQMLRSMREALVPKLPVSQKAELRQRLREAIERENYELAAILRDELRQMKD
ncbi:MAG: UvrB/UvrC motif-containing protein [Planctomycetota bacterium]